MAKIAILTTAPIHTPSLVKPLLGRNVLVPAEDALHVAPAMDALYTGDGIGGWVCA